ncbi:MAG TPA: sodium:proton antiporter NhaD [Candidatus Coprenecus stercoravium]|uniref:Sodium:proton antiporter NhaD n=1 Tax=Candidatus Coprenecus stercoravium TaxID=2840735 RepID=A0A9D2GQL4_9BACT|nr:sodium:proton antiporter NhaD [Candidatus Coprenecus stercoravium]
MIVLFIVGYFLIAVEHRTNVSKSSVALVLCCILWGLLSIFSSRIDPALTHDVVSTDLLAALGSTCEIIIFLIGAMTIVDIIDTHGGFEVITRQIKTRRKTRLMWLIAFLTFFMSSVLDNMTTTIIMVMLMRRMLSNYKERWLFASIIIIAANCGGAWSPIGDVTTIMLWMKGNVGTAKLMSSLILPSLVSVVIPTAVATRFLKGMIARQQTNEEISIRPSYITGGESRTILILGVLLLIMVPVFKSVAGLPPYMSVMFALGILWFYTDMMYRRKRNVEESVKQKVSKVIKHIDMPTILFFLGILMAVSALECAGILGAMAEGLNKGMHNIYAINTVIGLLSSVIDNVPLVAASMGMYPIPDAAAIAASADPEFLSHFVADGDFWHLLAYCAGTGGSILIIGSAAGVVAMGLENINFMWYFKNISFLALIGYLAGIGIFILQDLFIAPLL